MEKKELSFSERIKRADEYDKRKKTGTLTVGDRLGAINVKNRNRMLSMYGKK